MKHRSGKGAGVHLVGTRNSLAVRFDLMVN